MRSGRPRREPTGSGPGEGRKDYATQQTVHLEQAQAERLERSERGRFHAGRETQLERCPHPHVLVQATLRTSRARGGVRPAVHDQEPQRKTQGGLFRDARNRQSHANGRQYVERGQHPTATDHRHHRQLQLLHVLADEFPSRSGRVRVAKGVQSSQGLLRQRDHAQQHVLRQTGERRVGQRPVQRRHGIRRNRDEQRRRRESPGVSADGRVRQGPPMSQGLRRVLSGRDEELQVHVGQDEAGRSHLLQGRHARFLASRGWSARNGGSASARSPERGRSRQTGPEERRVPHGRDGSCSPSGDLRSRDGRPQTGHHQATIDGPSRFASW
ncbi:hypothetical protein [Cyprinid herpesvirus 2]|nr:hypothetical protein [Cyprinid herpesvirus 2]